CVFDKFCCEMVKCFVVGCSTGYKSAKENDAKVFKPPKEERQFIFWGKKSKAKGLSIINGEVHKIGAYNTYIDHVVYDLSGYLIHARQKRIENCKECMETLITKEDIPNDSEYPE
ncbi:Uncharacterized protein APZ42_009398, partial [Daphnia magna]